MNHEILESVAFFEMIRFVMKWLGTPRCRQNAGQFSDTLRQVTYEIHYTPSVASISDGAGISDCRS